MPQRSQTYQRPELPVCSSSSTQSIRWHLGQGGITTGDGFNNGGIVESWGHSPLDRVPAAAAAVTRVGKTRSGDGVRRGVRIDQQGIRFALTAVARLADVPPRTRTPGSEAVDRRDFGHDPVGMRAMPDA
jgi:hypothetical protein